MCQFSFPLCLILQLTGYMSTKCVEKIVVASCALHNYLRTNVGARYIAPGFLDRAENDGTLVDGQWCNEQNLNSIQQQGSNFYSRETNS